MPTLCAVYSYFFTPSKRSKKKGLCLFVTSQQDKNSYNKKRMLFCKSYALVPASSQLMGGACALAVPGGAVNALCPNLGRQGFAYYKRRFLNRRALALIETMLK